MAETEPAAPRRQPLWLVRRTVERPCCVCWTSICTAFATTAIMLGGLASGAFAFELDMSPASFKVKHDSIADRGDAYLVWRRSSTARSPRWLDDSAGPGVGGGCDYGACDTGSFRNASRFFAPWEGCSIFYEARAGEGYVEGGAAGAPTPDRTPPPPTTTPRLRCLSLSLMGQRAERYRADHAVP